MQFDDTLSNLIASQFPEFYNQDGPAFIAFLEAYYEYLDEQRVTRNLLSVSDSDGSIGDIGNSIDLFADHFKNQYLINFPNTTSVDKSFLVKHIQDFYKSKGSTASIKLLLQLLFGVNSEVYVPGDDIIRASDGKWIQPYYLEVTKTKNINQYIGTKITGSSTGATAYVESISRSRTNGKFVVTLYLSNLVGNFETGEFISNDGNFHNVPQITGSLSSITILDPGASNSVGDIFDIAGAYGSFGQARVSAVSTGAGKVSFDLIDGGTGYILSSPLDISQVTLTYNTANGVFDEQTNLYQSIYQINFSAVSGNSFVVGHPVTAYSATANVTGTGVVVGTPNTTSILLNSLSGNFANTSYITSSNSTSNGAFSNLSFIPASGVITGANSTYVGVMNVNNSFYAANGSYFYSYVSNSAVAAVSAQCSFVSSGAGANASIGSLSNVETITLYTDCFTDFNTANNPFLTLALNGSNSGVGITSANGLITANTTSSLVTGVNTVFSTLTGNVVNIYVGNTYLGTVNSITSNTSLTLLANSKSVTTSNAFSYNYGQLGIINDPTGNYNTTLSSLLASESINIGSIATLTNLNPGNGYNQNPIVGPYNKYVAGFEKHDYIINIKNVSGILSPGSTVNQVYVANNIYVGTATAIITSANSSQISAKRTSFAYDITTLFPIVILDENQNNVGSANVVSVYKDNSSPVMGENAIIGARAKSAIGLATSLQVINSGINYTDGEYVTLTNNSNPIPIYGTARVKTQGIGIGYWQDNSGNLNSNKYIHDNDYYQEFSYEIQTSISFDKYVNILKKLVHIAGMKVFGRVIIENTAEQGLEGESGITNTLLLPLLLNNIPITFNNSIIYI